MITDDEIAERIAGCLRRRFDAGGIRDPTWASHDVTAYLDDCEAYRLAHVGDVRERAAMRRQQKRVRAKVFAALGVADRK